MKSVIPIILFIIGESILITLFLLFGKEQAVDILRLNIVVSSIVYTLIFIDLFRPWNSNADRSQKRLGSLVILWVVTLAYSFLAIGTMVLFTLFLPLPFLSQLAIHTVMIFLLLIGLYSVFSVGKQMESVHKKKSIIFQALDELKALTTSIVFKLNNIDDISPELKSRILNLCEDIKYTAPINNKNARVLERKMISFLDNTKNGLDSPTFNESYVGSQVLLCEELMSDRKQMYLNQ